MATIPPRHRGKRRAPSLLALLGMAAAIGGYITGPAMGQQAPSSQPFADPPLLQSLPPGVVKPPAGLRARAVPITPPRAGAERFYDLTIQEIPATIEDPFGVPDPADPSRYKRQRVNLRGYADTNRPPPGPGDRPPFVAPQIEVTPGDTIRITLRNKLASNDPSCTGPMDSLHCFNTTNLHSHGLWISPTGNSDNVLLSIKPGVDFQYEYNIPADHPAGTFWYHPHRHGSTALQVASGMVGAIIIKGDRLPSRDKNGDLDTLLIDPESKKPFLEHVLLFQQIPYACRDKEGKIDVYPDGPRKGQWRCQDNAVGTVSGADNLDNWDTSGRWTSINGLVLPRFGATPDKKIDAGQLVRMRLIHGGIRQTITVQFRKRTAPLPAALNKDSLAAVINSTCNGDIVPYQVVAADGLTMDRTLTQVQTTLQPGYRYDLLTIFPEAGEYCLLDLAKKGAVANQDVPFDVLGQDVPLNLLGFVTVGGTRKITDVTRELVETLVKSARAHMPAGVRDDIVKDLRTVEAGRPVPHLTRFVPHPTVTDDEVKGVPDEDMVFFLGPFKPGGPAKFTVGNDFAIVKNADDAFIPKGAADYDPTRVDRYLTLGTAQTWELRSYGVSHPFHIHVNPFQIVAIFNPDGIDISQPGVADTKDGKDGKDCAGNTSTAADNEYAGLKNVWKDTLFVRTCIPFGKLQPDSKDYYRFIVRTRYERYIGEFVLHCHILDHEDEGMMQNVQIDLPGDPGGMSHEH